MNADEKQQPRTEKEKVFAIEQSTIPHQVEMYGDENARRSSAVEMSRESERKRKSFPKRKKKKKRRKHRQQKNEKFIQSGSDDLRSENLTSSTASVNAITTESNCKNLSVIV